jgi:hypothetical protein
MMAVIFSSITRSRWVSYYRDWLSLSELSTLRASNSALPALILF